MLVFSTIVQSQLLDFPSSPILHLFLPFKKDLQDYGLVAHRIHPNSSLVVINIGEEPLFTSKRSIFRQTPNTCLNIIKDIFCLMYRYAGYYPSLLAKDIVFTKFDLSRFGTFKHSLLHQSLKLLLTGMTKSHVPKF